ncbi:MAG: T9SS type A sorting domain-containing protein [Bacteroidota bacterium]
MPQKLGLLALWMVLFVHNLPAQTAFERSVLLSAQLLENPDRIALSWSNDVTAQRYEIYRKSLSDTNWGERLALLPGSDSTFVDHEVSKGQAYEYAVFKKGFEELRDTFCVPIGRELRFQISDMYGIGLCCNFGFGYYRLEACDSIYIEGSDFAWGDTQLFTPCASPGDTCTPVQVIIQPDMFPNSTSWELFDNQSGALLATSGPVGSFIDERPKYGYIYAGAEVPALEDRGGLLLLIDSTWVDSLSSELAILQLDLIRDGWQVYRQVVGRSQSPSTIRSLIQDQYEQIDQLNALFIIGHVPVPYSGDIYPDTHTEHRGAWAADSYYAELDGNWTDELVDITTAQFAYNHNVPGDGRFDQDSIPTGQVELQVGRIDFFNMPAFAQSELALLRQYLRKNHLFRTEAIQLERRALVDDNFLQAFAAPAASAWRNFAPMFGADQIDTSDYFTTLRENSYLWSYGCGSGSHISAEGIGTTADFAADSLLTAFTMLFGSQFGDWDNENNFLRAPLASGLTLTNCWAGNPPWTFHQMAMGHTIGYCAQSTQNSQDGVYLNGPQLVHTALMGDPSLRLHPFGTPSSDSLWLNSDGFGVQLQWSASNDSDLLGYYLYRTDTLHSSLIRIHDELITDTQYVDAEPFDGKNVYFLRPVRMEYSASGTYLNPGLAIIDSVDFERIIVGQKEISVSPPQIRPNPSTGQLTISWATTDWTSPSVELWNSFGQKVRVQEIRQMGNALQVDASNLSSGIYIISIQEGDKRYSQRLVLIR